jgi:hypothetical protein
MLKTCEVCPTEFEAKRAAAKYCSEKCKKRAQRRPGGTRAAKVVTLPPAAPVSAGSLAAATQAELDRAGRLASAVGQAALALARRIDASHGETGSALAALVREHRATLAEAVKDAEVAADPLDELRGRRERKLAGN